MIYLEPEEVRHEDGRIEHPTVRRESRDVTLGLILAILAGGALVGTVSAFAIWQVLVPEQQPTADQRSSYAPPPLTTELPRPPRLDPLMTEEPEVREAIPYGIEAVQRLHRYGPTDAPDFVHIPIAKAIELTAGRLPARAAPAPKSVKDRGLVGGGESNSGRLYQDLPSWLRTPGESERQESNSRPRIGGRQP